MAYKKSNGCPYLKSYNNVCTHKGTIPSLKRNNCPYKNPMKCRLFRIWSDIVEKSKSTPINPTKKTIEEIR